MQSRDNPPMSTASLLPPSDAAVHPAQRPVVITQGDVAGIGPEIIARLFHAGAARGEPLQGVLVLGDVGVLRRAAALLCRHPDVPALPVAVIERVDDVWQAPAGTLPVLPMRTPVPGLAQLPWARVDARAGQAAAACIREAVTLALQGEVGAVVTAPIHKEALAAAGEPYPGHTEMLAAESGPPGQPVEVRMMLANEELKTVLVTVHCSLRQAIERIDQAAVLSTLRIAHGSARAWGQPRPRIAVAGLNPHAGEGGLFGREEIDIIAPAIAQARAEGIDATGPYAPDTVFMRARRGEFDLVLAMYHDQGLIPVKYLGVEQGVNVTLGLPFVRTSPDHGTAFDLAGRGLADASSLGAALRMARQLQAGA
jgi:4-hydroxythreonine-4-phosphate dehydrogenase